MQRQMHHGPPGPARPPGPPQSLAAARQTLMQMNEAVWINIGKAHTVDLPLHAGIYNDMMD